MKHKISFAYISSFPESDNCSPIFIQLSHFIDYIILHKYGDFKEYQKF
nr:MAG TPA: hypothetical protein [Inoviridae sp.]